MKTAVPTRRDLADVLAAVGRGKIYRSGGGFILRQMRVGQNRRCDIAVRTLILNGFVAVPAPGEIHFALTDDGRAALALAGEL